MWGRFCVSSAGIHLPLYCFNLAFASLCSQFPYFFMETATAALVIIDYSSDFAVDTIDFANQLFPAVVAGYPFNPFRDFIDLSPEPFCVWYRSGNIAFSGLSWYKLELKA